MTIVRCTQEFHEMYDKWRDTADSIQLSQINKEGKSATMLEELAKQGFVGDLGPGECRYRSKSCDFYNILESARSKSELDVESLKGLSMIKGTLEFIEGKRDEFSMNPSDIMFTDKVRWTKQGKVTREKPVYGHYATAKYAYYRNKFNGGSVKAVPREWYSKKKGEARPPVWQALFGIGDTPPFLFPGLLNVLETVLSESNFIPETILEFNNVQLRDIERFITTGRAKFYPLFLPFSPIIRGYDVPLRKGFYKCGFCSKRGHRRENCVELETYLKKYTEKERLFLKLNHPLHVDQSEHSSR